MFGTKDVEEGRSVQKWIRPGVQEVVIDSVQGIDADKAYLEFKFRLLDSGPEDCNAQRMYIHTAKSLRLNLSRIKYIAKHVVNEQEIDNCESESVLEYGEQLDAILSGKKLRMKFNGEQYIKDGQIKTRVTMPLNNFCEALIPGAAYPVVPAEMYALRYIEATDLKTVPVPSEVPTDESNDELPF